MSFRSLTTFKRQQLILETLRKKTNNETLLGRKKEALTRKLKDTSHTFSFFLRTFRTTIVSEMYAMRRYAYYYYFRDIHAHHKRAKDPRKVNEEEMIPIIKKSVVVKEIIIIIHTKEKKEKIFVALRRTANSFFIYV